MVAVRLVPVGPVRCGSQSWRSAGSAFATIIVKATFAFDEHGLGHIVDGGDEVLLRDEHYDGNPTKSLRDCSDLAPYLAYSEVLFRGSAHVPKGQSVIARVLVARGNQPLVDKRVAVRSPAGGAVAMIAENALGGPGNAENPVGKSEPLITSVIDAGVPALVGPIARAWRVRAALLRPQDKAAFKRKELAIEEGFAWGFFHAAPLDQRTPSVFMGNETIVLEHLEPEAARVIWTLPDARAAAIWMRPDGAPVPIALRADVLRIDGDKRRVSLTWRGFFEVAEAQGRMVVAAGVALPERPIQWPAILPVDADDDQPEPGANIAITSLDSTGILHLDGLNAPTLPFAFNNAETMSEPRSARPIPGAPFGKQQSAVAQPPPPAPAPVPAPAPAFVPAPPVAAVLPRFAPIAVAPPDPAKETPSDEVVVLGPGLGSVLLLAVVDAVKPR